MFLALDMPDRAWRNSIKADSADLATLLRQRLEGARKSLKRRTEAQCQSTTSRPEKQRLPAYARLEQTGLHHGLNFQATLDALELQVSRRR